MFYQRHLQRLGLLVTSLILFNIIVTSLLLIRQGTFISTLRHPAVFIRPVIGMVTGMIIYFSAKNVWLRKKGFVVVLILTILYTVMTYVGQHLQVSLDISLILMILSAVTFFEIDRNERAWKKVLRNDALTLDIRIAARSELFDPVVMMPHLEVNEKIISAIDRLLNTSADAAPLKLNIHSSEKVSDSLKNTFTECLRMHYRDERKQIVRFLENRYNRILGLLILSVLALIIWTSFSPAEDAGDKVLWQILGNFAAFSLWQIGSTHFERSEAYLNLMRLTTAENLSITFHERRNAKAQKDA